MTEQSARVAAGEQRAQIEAGLFWTLIALLAGVVVTTGPILTNDGPAHLSMAHFMLRAGDPTAPMLNQVYQLNPAISPNVLGHILLSSLVRILPPLVAEQVFQLACLTSIPIAARLVLRKLSPDAGWVALFFFPVALQRLFYLGLYNFSLSLTFSLLCIWAYLRLRDRISATNFGVLAALLLLAMASQASGWIAAAMAITTMAGVETAMRWHGGAFIRCLAPLPLAVALALLPGVVLLALFALQSGGQGDIVYGADPLQRLLRVARGDAFATIGRPTTIASLLSGALLFALFVMGATALALRAQPPRGAADRLAIAACTLPVCFLALVLIMPERAGGGWTHVWRAEVFPYIGLALAVGALPSTPRLLRAFCVAAAGTGSFVVIGMAFWLQAYQVPTATREFQAVDALIGPHCTLAPILGELRLDASNSARIVHQPLFHIASRYELSGDRPVLFNYLARLPIYPVTYRADADPKVLLFGWLPGQRDTRVLRLLPADFEAGTGISVDFLLLWDVPEQPSDQAYPALRSVVRSQFDLAHRSPSGRLELYRRRLPGGCEAR